MLYTVKIYSRFISRWASCLVRTALKWGGGALA